MVSVLLSTAALASGLHGAVGAQAAADNADRAVGLSAAVGTALGERLALEAVVEGQRTDSAELAARSRGELRWALASAS